MEFANDRCDICGAEFGDAKPKSLTKVKEPYTTWYGKYVEFVAPCPSCHKEVPAWGGDETEAEAVVAEAEPEAPSAAEPEPEEEKGGD